MNTLQFVMTKYPGQLHLTVPQLAEEMAMEEKSVLNAISAGRFPVPTFKKGKRRVADIRDYAAYIDQQRSK